ncbi:MAG: N-acetylmuramic acid 6-phosphate etherase [Frankiaceae bacterium]|nr:N-acetylmuramic acid 6-phosphate etherase [Frankiaceae bacterium]MDQ1725958.1 N-acetylmuramic acid 6-phosphate etherase [Frankiaceae bacterium]
MTDSPARSPEDVRPDWSDLDLRSTDELVHLWADEEESVARAVAGAHAELVAAVDAIAARAQDGGRLVYVGAGTPGRLAWLDAVECPPTFGCEPDLVQAIIAGGSRAFTGAIEADEDDASTAPGALAAIGVTARDTVVCVSASGRTPFVLRAAEYARELGALTIAVCNAPGSALAGQTDLAVVLLTGPEILSGSSRLKAASAQKTVMNMMSTLLMVRLGHTYGNLMVGVKADNEKLRGRTRRIVEQATGEPADVVDAMIQRCGGDLKAAIVALLTDGDPAHARERLRETSGRVREAVAN